MMSARQKRLRPLRAAQSGFTLIELVIVVIILGILLTVVATTYRGVQAKNRNSQRETDITTLQGGLETYYAQTSMYPTTAELNSTTWVVAHLHDTPLTALRDPNWSTRVKDCTSGGQSILIGHPALNCYSYQPVSNDGSSCDNVKKICAHYTLTAELEGGSRFTKSSLN
jgi:prepilin-type N-terminal cleavage/methylation domain-containing protein